MIVALAVAQFFILPGDFPDTVEEYSKQADMSILYFFDARSANWTTPLVEGYMEPRDALKALLAGLPVKAMYPYRRTITLTTTNKMIPAKPEFFRRNGWAYNCVRPQYLAGMLFNGFGRRLLDMGFIDAEYYCTKDHRSDGPPNDSGWAITRLPSRFRSDALLLTAQDEVLIEATRPIGINHGPRPSW
jgi:hypothetical protein